MRRGDGRSLLAQKQEIGAGWSSPVARQAHNLKVRGSNPLPATTDTDTPASPAPGVSSFCGLSNIFAARPGRRSGGGADEVLASDGPRQKLVDPSDGVIGDAAEDVMQTSFRIEAVALGTLDRGADRGGALAAGIGAGEQMILAAECHRPFILPTSLRSWRFITAGIPILAIRFACGALSGERQANFFKFWVRRASSLRSPDGWLIRWPAPE